MPTGLREIESSFKQVQKEYQNYAHRRQLLAVEVRTQKVAAVSVRWIMVSFCAGCCPGVDPEKNQNRYS